MSDAKERLIEHLLEFSVKRGDFTLKSGKQSNWFLDAKQTCCRAEGILLVAELALEVIPDDVTAIGGLTVGADPVAYGVAAVAATRGRELRSFTIRKEAKDHGVAGRMAGALLPGDKVVITEDAVTRGTSPIEAAMVVRELGAEPVMILPVVDRGGTCGDMAAERGHRLPPPGDRARPRLPLREGRLSGVLPERRAARAASTSISRTSGSSRSTRSSGATSARAKTPRAAMPRIPARRSSLWESMISAVYRSDRSSRRRSSARWRVGRDVPAHQGGHVTVLGQQLDQGGEERPLPPRRQRRRGGPFVQQGVDLGQVRPHDGVAGALLRPEAGGGSPGGRSRAQRRCRRAWRPRSRGRKARAATSSSTSSVLGASATLPGVYRLHLRPRRALTRKSAKTRLDEEADFA